MFWSNYFKNPSSIILKKYLYEMLKEKYAPNEKIIDKVCENINEKEEAESFAKLINDTFQNGYMMAINQQKESLAKLGMKMNITNASEISRRSENKIFNHSEKSG